ncbi:MAG: PIG-L deacetylase family protein [Clostridia bacterium]
MHVREKRLRMVCLVSISLFLLPGKARAAAPTSTPHPSPTPNLTWACTLTSTNERDDVHVLTDGNPNTYLLLTAGNSVTLRWGTEQVLETVLIDWKTLNGTYTVTFFGASGKTLQTDCYGKRDMTCLIPIAPGSTSVTITANQVSRLDSLQACDGNTVVPEHLHPWKRPLQKADLLIVSAHPDDEIVMFGGLIPTYAGQRGYATQVVYMTMHSIVRYREAHEGLWLMHVEHAPVIGPFVDEKDCPAWRYRSMWDGKDAVVGYLVEQLRRFRPLVVVSHDLLGEYGHGAHRVTAESVLCAVEVAGDPTQYPESAGIYGAWQVQKLYLHLYPEHPIQLNFDQPLSAFEGKTAMDIAVEAFGCHKSQRPVWLTHLRNRTYDCSLYGLAYSAVGADVNKDDLFENIPEYACTMYAQDGTIQSTDNKKG